MSLINDILDFSKIEAGKLDLELLGVDVRQLTEDVVELLSHDAESKGLTFGCDVDSSVSGSLCGDAGQLRQVLMKLVSNAVKFTEHGDVARCASWDCARIRSRTGAKLWRRSRVSRTRLS